MYIIYILYIYVYHGIYNVLALLFCESRKYSFKGMNLNLYNLSQQTHGTHYLKNVNDLSCYRKSCSHCFMYGMIFCCFKQKISLVVIQMAFHV